MKPTHAKLPNIRDWDDIRYRMGRAPTDREKEEIVCVWAGQTGHEKCGWCRKCNRPRSMESVVDGKKCEHPQGFVWKIEA